MHAQLHIPDAVHSQLHTVKRLLDLLDGFSCSVKCYHAVHSTLSDGCSHCPQANWLMMQRTTKPLQVDTVLPYHTGWLSILKVLVVHCI